MKLRPILIALIAITFLNACDEGPKVTNISNEKTDASDDYMPDELKAKTVKKTSDGEMHRVVVNEVLPTSKYVYLNVNEGDREYWVAALKQDVEVGGVYVFKGGLLKTNFESKEYNRLFKEVYLVTNLTPEHGSEGPKTTSQDVLDHSGSEEPYKYEKQVIKGEGSMKIADLVADSKKMEGQTVQLSGVCVKINSQIMGRNWIHLKDGSKDDFDMVITSDEFVPEGSIVTMKGIVTLNKDFGAGYKYDLIVEEGVILK